MTVRERIEQTEHQILCPYACFADESRGRAREEAPCPYRTCFQRDRDRRCFFRRRATTTARG